VAQPRPAGGGWISGPRPGCSTNSRRCCWTSSARPAASTLSVSASTASACGRSGGSDRRQPGRSGQGRLQAACGRRPWWAADLGGGERGQRERFDDVRGGAGRHPADPDAQRAAASTAGQGPCRQGLRSSPLPGVPSPAWYPTADRPAHDRVLGAPGTSPVDDQAHGSWLGGWRRLRILYERSCERFYALVLLACAVICFNILQQPPW
jgi:hypothetical protein